MVLVFLLIIISSYTALQKQMALYKTSIEEVNDDTFIKILTILTAGAEEFVGNFVLSVHEACIPAKLESQVPHSDSVTIKLV